MRIYCLEDYQAVSRRAAHILAAQVMLNPACVLGLATGSTPLGAYSALGGWCAAGEVSFKRVRTVNLDEYVGLGPDHLQSYRYFMQKNLFEHIDILAENTHLPDGLAQDPAKECLRYDRVIESLGGVDLQLLGMGLNGHIGFNEPAEAFSLGTNRVALAQSTIEANARFFDSKQEVPKAAYTMGIRSILQARRILVVVTGAGKADIIYQAFHGPVTPAVPASILQLHGDVILCGDKPALAKLLETGVEACG